MNRKFVRRCISLITVFGILLMFMLQAAATNDAVESAPQRFDPAVYEVQLRVTTENCESVISKYDVPDEVADRIRELCQEYGVTELLVPGVLHLSPTLLLLVGVLFAIIKVIS